MIERDPALQEFIDRMFPEEAQRIRERKCPFCGKKIEPGTEFKDELSKREFEISGMCQKCQDEIFKEPEEY